MIDCSHYFLIESRVLLLLFHRREAPVMVSRQMRTVADRLSYSTVEKINIKGIAYL